MDYKSLVDSAIKGEKAQRVPFLILDGGTPEKAYTESVAAIKAANGKPFALMPGCDLPYGTPMANLQAMAKAVHDTAI